MLSDNRISSGLGQRPETLSDNSVSNTAEKIGKIVGSCWKFLFPNGVKNLSSGWKSRLQTPNT